MVLASLCCHSVTSVNLNPVGTNETIVNKRSILQDDKGEKASWRKDKEFVKVMEKCLQDSGKTISKPVLYNQHIIMCEGRIKIFSDIWVLKNLSLMHPFLGSYWNCASQNLVREF